jgi:3-methyladenine DNA glycosylase AlkD
MKLTKELVLSDIATLREGYKTKDIDILIKRYVKAGADVSALREHILEDQVLHRIYYFVALKQLKDVYQRMEFIHQNLLFTDWWHTDQLIKFVSDMDFDEAFGYAKEYVKSNDPFIRRWGYVLFISKLCRNKENLGKLLTLFKNDDHYTNQMAEGWLICELAIFFPEEMLGWFKNGNKLNYKINSKAIQKICDSYRITDEVKARFKAQREFLRNREDA